MREELLINEGWLFHEGELPVAPIMGKFDTYMISKAQCALGAADPLFFDEDFEEVRLPHDYVLKGSPTHDANETQGSFFRNNAWYRRHFIMPCSHEHKRVILYFEGVGQHTEVWANGQFAGSNDSMYNGFYVDITPYLWEDNAINTIAVHITIDKIEGWWYEGAGIYRNVHMIITDEISVDHWGVWVNPQKNSDDTWTVPVETTIFSMCDDEEKITLVQSIIDENGQVVETVSNDFSVMCEDNLVNQSMMIKNPILWNVGDAHLYTLKTQIIRDEKVTDETTTSFGFRTLEFDHENGLFVNGNHVKVRGGCLHQDHTNLGVAVPDSICELRLAKMQECGMNAARLAHNNHSSAVTHAADKLGMLILDENRWFNYSERTQKELVSMIKRDRNHPSVFVWSVGNEEPLQGTQIGWKLVRSMRRVIRKYDTTRPVTLALNGGFYDSYAAKASDVGGVNYNLGGYQKFADAHKNKCLLVTESVASNNARSIYFKDTTVPSNETHSTSYDEKRASFGSTFRDAVEASEINDFVIGTLIWTGIEYRGEANWPRLFSNSAPIDQCLFEKDSFYQLSSYWKDEPILHVMPHWSFPDRVGESVKVVVYTNQDEVELFLNGKTLGKKTCEKFNAPTWDVTYENGELLAVAYKNGKESMRTCHKTVGEPCKLHLVQAKDTVVNSGEDVVVINVHTTDENGDFVPNANQRIHFICCENAEIIAVSGGDTLDHEDVKAHDKKMFGGRVQAILRVKEGAKSVKINAECKELNLCESIDVKVTDVPNPVRLENCKNNLSFKTVRLFDKTVTNDDGVNDKYNFADMNSNEPITLPYASACSENDYSIVMGNALIPLAKSTMAIKFANLKGSGKVKVFHEENCWPNPTPEEFITIIKEYNFASETDLVIPLEKFAANEKMAFVLSFSNNKEFNLEDVSFIKL